MDLEQRIMDGVYIAMSVGIVLVLSLWYLTRKIRFRRKRIGKYYIARPWRLFGKNRNY